MLCRKYEWEWQRRKTPFKSNKKYPELLNFKTYINSLSPKKSNLKSTKSNPNLSKYFLFKDNYTYETEILKKPSVFYLTIS